MTETLKTGDHLSRAEFERRYQALPELKKAELIEGIVYVGSPVSTQNHGDPHSQLVGWLYLYRARTPGLQTADNATVRLDQDNEPQPDAFLRVLPEKGGQSRDDGPYVAGAPELVVEIAASSSDVDLGSKKNAYRRNGVQEYLVWRVREAELDWFVLGDAGYEPLAPDANGLLKSPTFPGLWLDRPALLAGEHGPVRDQLQRGLESPEHAAFVRELDAR